MQATRHLSWPRERHRRHPIKGDHPMDHPHPGNGGAPACAGLESPAASHQQRRRTGAGAFLKLATALAALSLATGFSPVARAAPETVLYSFPGFSSSYGVANGSPLITDGSGNLYGTSEAAAPSLTALCSS
jgi:hypothetical protein